MNLRKKPESLTNKVQKVVKKENKFEFHYDYYYLGKYFIWTIYFCLLIIVFIVNLALLKKVQSFSIIYGTLIIFPFLIIGSLARTYCIYKMHEAGRKVKTIKVSFLMAGFFFSNVLVLLGMGLGFLTNYLTNQEIFNEISLVLSTTLAISLWSISFLLIYLIKFKLISFFK